MFKKLHDTDTETVTIEFEGRPIEAPAGISVAAAVLSDGVTHTRTTPVSGSPRAPYCLMGICFECLMEIDGVPNRQACMTHVRNGMKVRRQPGARGIENEV
ncbi:(2Fe-2S)-binding protein [Desulfococcaceae bacterium HSG7]|nr:(2Fe-2S)-binding protein [Desulfococcaceae bacterium HSG7]